MALVAAWNSGAGDFRLLILLQDGFHAERLTAGRSELGSRLAFDLFRY